MKTLPWILLLAAAIASAQTPGVPTDAQAELVRPATKPGAGSVPGSFAVSAGGPRGAGKSVSAAPSAEVVLFGASWCAYCRQARAYLARVRVKYKDVNIDSPEGKAAYAAAGGGGVPLLVFKGEQLRGYSELAYDSFFARLE